MSANRFPIRLLAALLAFACTPDLTRPPGLLVSCGEDEDCSADQVCRFGRCTTARVGGVGEPCTQEGRCDAALTCIDKACEPASGFGLTPIWAFGLGDSGAQRIDAFAVDGAGNAYFAGAFGGSIVKDGVQIQGPTGREAFLARMDASGRLQWAKAFDGSENNQLIYGLSLGPDGSSVTITGFYYGNLDLGGVRLTGNHDNVRSFVARYDPEGNLLWARGFGDGGALQGFGVATAADGSCWAAGHFSSGLSIDGFSLQAGGREDAYLLKFNASGKVVKALQFGAADEDDFATGVAVDSNGNAFLTGTFGGSVDFGTGPLVNTKFDVFLAKFSPDGRAIWARQVKRDGGNSDFVPWHLATGPDGAVYVATDFSGAADLGDGSPALHADDQDALVLAFNEAGTLRWAQVLGGHGYQDALGIDAGSGTVHVTGVTVGTIDTLGEPRRSAGGADAFLASFDPEGHPLGLQLFGDTAHQQGTGVGVDASRNLFLGGQFEGKVNFGAGSLTSMGDDDLFVARFAVRR